MKLKIRKLNIYSLLVLSVFFDAYALVYIKTYPVTIFTIVSIFVLVHNIINNRNRYLKITQQSVIQHPILIPSRIFGVDVPEILTPDDALCHVSPIFFFVEEHPWWLPT